MNKIMIIAVGSVKEDFYRAKINSFMNEIKKYADATLVEVNDESIPQNASRPVIDEIKNKEGTKILEHISAGDYVAALCIDGVATDKKGLAEIAGKNYGGNIVFVIGGSLGLGEAVIKRANYKLSFSNMTFPHRLMRVMLLEQLAKAVKP